MSRYLLVIAATALLSSPAIAAQADRAPGDTDPVAASAAPEAPTAPPVGPASFGDLAPEKPDPEKRGCHTGGLPAAPLLALLVVVGGAVVRRRAWG